MSASPPPGLAAPPARNAAARVRVRRGRRSDADRLWRMEREVFPREPLDVADLERLLAGAASLVLVAESGTDLAGFLILWWRRGATTCRVIDLAVRRRYRRLGLGGRLLDAALREARRRGFLGVTLEVAAGNRPALALYRGFGFRLDRHLPHYYRRGRHALRLLRWLEPHRGMKLWSRPGQRI